MAGDREEGPAPAGTGCGPDTKSPTLDDTEGLFRKQLAFDLFKQHRAELVREAVRIMVQIATERCTVTTDDVREMMSIPSNVNPKWLGVVPVILARKGILRHAGYVKSRRAKAHGREIKVWELVREPRPGELDNLCTGSNSLTRKTEPRTSDRATTQARPDRQAVGAGMLSPDLRPPHCDEGKRGRWRDGRRWRP